MQISIVILLFSDQISGRGKSFQGANCLRGAPPFPPVGESQQLRWYQIPDCRISHTRATKILPLVLQLAQQSVC